MSHVRCAPLEALRSILDGTGLPWTTERGKNHVKVRLAGRLVAVLPRTAGNQDRHVRNNAAAIRRAARELRG